MLNKIKWDDLFVQDMNKRKYKENFDWIKPNEIQKVGDAYWFKGKDEMLYYLYTTEKNQKGEAVIEAFAWDGNYSSFDKGHPCSIVETLKVCNRWDLSVVQNQARYGMGL